MRPLRAAVRRARNWALGIPQRLPEVLGPASLGSRLFGGIARRGVAAIPEPAALPSWMREQVAAELDFFRDGITPARLAAAEPFYAHQYHDHYAHYTVRAGRLRCLTSSRSFPAYIAERFRTMTPVFRMLAPTLPDIDFVLYLGDGFDGWSKGCVAPVLTFSKRAGVDESGLLIPDPPTLALAHQLRADAEAGCAAFPWDLREPLVFWRGTTTGGPFSLDNYSDGARFRLVEWSRRRPDLVDALFTGFHPASPDIEPIVRANGWLGQPVGIRDHFRFKYQVLVDGFTSPWPRFFWALQGDSVILKQETELLGWFDAGVEPWVHYLPLAPDLADLDERVGWARTHEHEVRAMVERAHRFACGSLSDSAMLGYMRLLLTRYASLLRSF
jgi:hypothetical protein